MWLLEVDVGDDELARSAPVASEACDIPTNHHCPDMPVAFCGSQLWAVCIAQYKGDTPIIELAEVSLKAL